jgi:hypothetical protein
MPILTVVDAWAQFRRTKRMADRAFEQLVDEALLLPAEPPPEQHSRHREAPGRQHALALDRLPHSDGEKPDRDRDSEFVEDLVPASRS